MCSTYTVRMAHAHHCSGSRLKGLKPLDPGVLEFEGEATRLESTAFRQAAYSCNTSKLRYRNTNKDGGDREREREREREEDKGKSGPECILSWGELSTSTSNSSCIQLCTCHVPQDVFLWGKLRQVFLIKQYESYIVVPAAWNNCKGFKHLELG